MSSIARVTIQPLVLVVEDEPVQLMDMVDLVERIGFAVVYAVNVDHAMALIEAHPTIRMVIADIQLADSPTGLRLAAMVRDRWPPVHIIVTTAGRAPKPCDLPTDTIFMAKPLDYKTVASSIRERVA